MRGENPRRLAGSGAPWDARLISLPQAGQKLVLSDTCVPQFAQYTSHSSLRVDTCQGSSVGVIPVS